MYQRYSQSNLLDSTMVLPPEVLRQRSLYRPGLRSADAPVASAHATGRPAQGTPGYLMPRWLERRAGLAPWPLFVVENDPTVVLRSVVGQPASVMSEHVAPWSAPLPGLPSRPEPPQGPNGASGVRQANVSPTEVPERNRRWRRHQRANDRVNLRVVAFVAIAAILAVLVAMRFPDFG